VVVKARVLRRLKIGHISTDGDLCIFGQHVSSRALGNLLQRELLL
jgi:hypothetical protein